MNNAVIRLRLSVMVSDQTTSGNEKMERITTLFEDEQLLNMQYYMEFCLEHGYTTPADWLKDNKHF